MEELLPLPYNDEAEKTLIGIIIECFDIDFLLENITGLTPNSFFIQGNAELFEYLQRRILQERVCVDFASIPHDISQYLGLGLQYQFESLKAELRKLELQREVMKSSSHLLNTVCATQEVNDIIGEVNDMANTISEEFSQYKEHTSKDVLEKAMNRIKDAISGGAGGRVLYHHPVLDSVMSVFRKQIHALGAFQGGGKTALALEAFRGQFMNGLQVAYFCTESSADELMLRIVASMAGLSIEKCLLGDLTESEQIALTDSFKMVNQYRENFNIYGLGDFNGRMSEVNSIASKLKRQKGSIDALYIDFLQDFKEPIQTGKRMDEREIIGYNVKAFKDIATKLDCVGTMLCQFNQQSHQDRMPTKKSFRGSGVIVDQSHIMTVIHNPNMMDAEDEAMPPVLDMIIYSVKTRLIAGFRRKIAFAGGKGSFFFPTRYSGDDIPNYSKQYSSK